MRAAIDWTDSWEMIFKLDAAGVNWTVEKSLNKLATGLRLRGCMFQQVYNRFTVSCTIPCLEASG